METTTEPNHDSNPNTTTIETQSSNPNTTTNGQTTTTTKRARKSRWDPPPSSEESEVTTKKRKSRWSEDIPNTNTFHVLVEADTHEAVDAAAGMVEKLLQPVDEVLNEHKRQQLRELAAINGTIRDEEYCRLCGEPGHRQFACPTCGSTFKSDVLCKIYGDGGHPTIDCPLKGTTGKKMDDEYQNFLAELGGTVPDGMVYLFVLVLYLVLVLVLVPVVVEP